MNKFKLLIKKLTRKRDIKNDDMKEKDIKSKDIKNKDTKNKDIEKKNTQEDKKGIKGTSIKTKLIIYFSVLILASSAIIGFIFMNKGSDMLIQEVEQSIALLTNEGAKLTQSRMETQMRALEMIAQRVDIQEMDWEKQRLVLSGQLERTGFIDMGVARPNGSTDYSSGGKAELGDRTYVQNALDGRTDVSDLVVSRVSNEIVMVYATPIERDGRVVGVLIGREDGNALSNIVEDIRYGEKGYTYMINDQGTIVAYPDGEGVLDQFNPIEEAAEDDSLRSIAGLFEKILSEGKGISRYTFEGDDLYAAYTPIEGTNWSFIVAANEAEVLSAVPELQRVIIIFTGIILLISIVVTYILGGSIVNPIIKAVEHSEEIANLDIAQDVPQV
ncbi:MAG: hypothetical protein GX329_00025, partial [Tissierellia bacterium]|nr:hypothetical protein [Tissierellia bacterium]